MSVRLMLEVAIRFLAAPKVARGGVARQRARVRVNGRRPLALASGALVVGLALAVPLTTAGQAQATTVTAVGYGAESCTAPSAAQMQAWWTGTRFLWWGVYIGGINRGCSQANLTASWVTTVSSQGWRLEPIWVGAQSACWGGSGTKFSNDPSTAYTQGQNEANGAYNALANLGFSPNINNNTPVVLDLEAFSQTSACITAAQQFVKGWDANLAVAPTQASGVYGSTSGSNLTAFTGAPPPAFIWGARWDGNPDTNVLDPVPSGDWSNQQRLKQYQGGHNETWGGTTLNIDSDNANGPVYLR